MEITKDIRYIGVNDHEIDLFERSQMRFSRKTEIQKALGQCMNRGLFSLSHTGKFILPTTISPGLSGMPSSVMTLPNTSVRRKVKGPAPKPEPVK